MQYKNEPFNKMLLRIKVLICLSNMGSFPLHRLLCAEDPFNPFIDPENARNRASRRISLLSQSR